MLLNIGSACGEADDASAPVAVPILEGTVDLEFGEIEGDDPYLFTRVGSVVEDTEGRLIVADKETDEVRVFDSRGYFVFRLGGPGEGPGELNGPCCLAFAPDGALWVRESTGFSAFRLETAGATFQGGMRSAHGNAGMDAPVTFDPLGRLVDVTEFRTSDGAYAMARLHMDEVHSPDGAVFEIVGPPGPGPRLSDDERLYGEEWIDRDLARIDGNFHPFDVPERKPPLADLFFDQSGRLWVEKTVADGAEMREADVYADSILVARYRWPSRVIPGVAPWATESVLLGTTRDELGVQRVARVRFRPAS